MSSWELVFEDPECTNWWICTDGEKWGVTHPCDEREEDDYVRGYITTTPGLSHRQYCGACGLYMSEELQGMFNLLACDQKP